MSSDKADSSPELAGAASAGSTRSPEPGTDKGWRELTLVIAGGLLAILGGVIAQAYQARTQLDQRAIEVRAREQERAVEALSELSTQMNGPLAAAFALQEGLVRREPDSSVRRLYSEYTMSRNRWIAARPFAQVRARVYFGEPSLREITRYDSTLDWVDSAVRRDYQTQLPTLSTTGLDTTTATFREYRRTILEARRLRQLGRDAVLNVLKNSLEIAGNVELIWAAQIQMRRAGSFDPLAQFVFTPMQEAELEQLRRKRDSLAESAKSAQRADTLHR